MFLSCVTGSLVKTFEVAPESIKHQCTLSSLNAKMTCVRYNHNGRILASSSVEGGISLHKASSGELLSQFRSPGDPPTNRCVNAVQFSSGSRFLASGDNGCIRLWDLKTQEIVQTYNVGASGVTSVAFSGYRDEHIVGGSASGAISMFDVRTAETTRYLAIDSVHGIHKVTAIQASSHPYTRHMLGSTYSDGSVRVWDLKTGHLTAEFAQSHGAPATSLALSPVSKVLLATGGLDGRVIFYDILHRKELHSLDLEQPVSSLALCADGKTLAVGTTMGEILVYDLRGAITPLFSTLAHEAGAVQSLHFSPLASDTVSSAMTPEDVPVMSTAHVSPCKSETLQEAVLKKLEILGMGSPRVQQGPQHCKCSSPSHSPTQLATRSAELPRPSLPQDRSNGFMPLAQQSTNRSVMSPPSHHHSAPVIEENLQSEPSPVSSLSTLSRELSDEKRSRFGERESSSSRQAEVEKSTMRTEVQRLRKEMELRRQDEVDQLSTLLESLMDRLDAVLEENRTLRQENAWLKSHVPAS